MCDQSILAGDEVLRGRLIEHCERGEAIIEVRGRRYRGRKVTDAAGQSLAAWRATVSQRGGGGRGA